MTKLPDLLDFDIRTQFDDFLNRANSLFDFNADKLQADTKEIEKKEYSADDSIVMSSEYVKAWYDSLESETPKYDLYDDYYYVIGGWLSWKHWSRTYIKFMKKNLHLFKDVKTVIDYGCGLGYSTLVLAQMFPDAAVIATNIPDSLQTKYAANFCMKLPNVQINSQLPKHCDIAFCSEYFEHFDKPIEHLKQIISENAPRIMVAANAFGQVAVGHFNTYHHDGKDYKGKEIAKVFGSTMKKYNYKKVKHDGWNNRPNVYETVVS